MNRELLLLLLQQAKSELDTTFAAVPEAKLTWKPLGNGRSALDLYAEAAQTWHTVESFVTSRGESQPDAGLLERQEKERATWTPGTAREVADAASESLLAAIATFTEERLAEPLTLHLEEDITMPTAGWIMMAYRTCQSRYAQINYIQTLYGDFEPH